MTEDAVLEILKKIQSDLADLAPLKRQVPGIVRTLNVVKQDVRMIRSTIHDMGKTRVTEGEIETLHEDVNRVQADISDLVTRVEQLEGQKSD